MSGRLDWFTSRVSDGGFQDIHIGPAEFPAARDIVQLDVSQSKLLMDLLGEVANDPALDWPLARQAILRAFYKAGLHTAR